jgi:hypothetical protein
MLMFQPLSGIRLLLLLLFTYCSFFYAGLKPAAFAALVPHSANKPLQELMEDFMGDHEMLVCVFIFGTNL